MSGEENCENCGEPKEPNHLYLCNPPLRCVNPDCEDASLGAKVVAEIQEKREDTAVDKGETSLSAREDENPVEPGESAAASEPDPVGWVEAETFETECSRGVVKFGAGDGLEELPEGTPLFTPEQFFELMERHRERACYCDGGDGVNEPECHFCAFVRNLREEFTQNGDSSE